MSDVLSPKTVQSLRDAGPKDLLWLICDSHEVLRAALAQAESERDEAQSAAIRCARLLRDFGARLREAERKIESETARAEARLKRARVAERLAEQRGETLRVVDAWLDCNAGYLVGNDESLEHVCDAVQAALADGGQETQEK